MSELKQLSEGKFDPHFVLGAVALLVMPMPDDVPKETGRQLAAALLRGANKQSPRNERLIGAFNFFLVVCGVHNSMSGTEEDVLRSLGYELFMTLDMTAEDFDYVEDHVVQLMKNDGEEAIDRAVQRARYFRDIVKRMQHGEAT